MYDCHPALLTPSGASFCDYGSNEHPTEIILSAVKYSYFIQLNITQ